MKINLAYGHDGLDVEIPDRNLQKVLTPAEVPPIENPDAFLLHATRASDRVAVAFDGRPKCQECLHRHQRHHAAGAEQDPPSAASPDA